MSHRRTTYRPRLVLAAGFAFLALALALAPGFAQEQQQHQEAERAPGLPPEDRPRGRVPAFEVLERVELEQIGGDVAVAVEVDGIETPRVVLIGPDGILMERGGHEATFEDLPQGRYLLAATAHKMRLAYGAFELVDGEGVAIALRLFNLPRYYAGEAETRILGLFTMDVAGGPDEGHGTLEIRSEPAGTMAIVGADGFVEIVPSPQETHVLESLEVDRYLIAVTVEDHEPAATAVVLREDQRVTLDVDLDRARVQTGGD